MSATLFVVRLWVGLLFVAAMATLFGAIGLFMGLPLHDQHCHELCHVDAAALGGFGACVALFLSEHTQ